MVRGYKKLAAVIFLESIFTFFKRPQNLRRAKYCRVIVADLHHTSYAAAHCESRVAATPYCLPSSPRHIFSHGKDIQRAFF